MEPGLQFVGNAPTFRLLRSVGLLRESPASPLLPALWVGLFSWLPLAAFALDEQLSLGRPGEYFRSFSLHVRCAVVLPVLFIAARLLDQRLGEAVRRFLDGRFVERPQVVERSIDRAQRAARSTSAEVGLWAVAFGVGQLRLWDRVSLAGIQAAQERTFPEFWLGVVTYPVSLYFVLRLLFAWTIWTALLWRFSRQRLRLEPIHPDLAGGLAHLAEPAQGLVLTLFGLSAATASAWADQILLRGASLNSYYVSLFALGLFSLALTFGPLLCFTPQLLAARMEGLRRYDNFSLSYTRQFDRRWLRTERQQAELGTPDIQSLADLAGGYQVASSMRLVPFSRQQLLQPLVAVLLPMLPLALTVVPLEKVLEQLGAALLGVGSK